MRVLLQDLRYAIRQLRKSPGFTAIAVVSLALAIGANTTIFSFANQMLFVKLGVPHPEQLRLLSVTGDQHVAVHNTWGNERSDNGVWRADVFSYPVYRQIARENSVLDANEIGIRLALGAMRDQIRAMVIRETGWLAGVGVVIGLGATLGLIKLIASMLYGLKPWDPVTLGCSTLLLLAVAFVAGWIPAQRASRVDPLDALRSE